MRITTLILIIFWLLPTTASADQKPLNMQEANTLGEREAWFELFERIEEVPPAKRDAKWNELLEHSAGHYVADRNPEFSDYRLNDVLSTLNRYQLLQKSFTYSEMVRSSLPGLMQQCLKQYNTQPCSTIAHSILIKTRPAKENDILKTANLVFQKGGQLDSLYIYGPLAAEQSKSVICKNEQLQLAVNKALQYDPDKEKTTAIALTLIKENCSDELLKSLTKDLSSEPHNNRYLKNLCPILLDKKMLKGLKRQRCEKAAQG